MSIWTVVLFGVRKSQWTPPRLPVVIDVSVPVQSRFPLMYPLIVDPMTSKRRRRVVDALMSAASVYVEPIRVDVPAT